MTAYNTKKITLIDVSHIIIIYVEEDPSKSLKINADLFLSKKN